MTREEEIKEIAGAFATAIDEVKDTCNPASKRGLLYAGFVYGAGWADSHPRWISVEDELPKEDVFVQVVCDDYVNIARRHKNRWQLGFCTKTANHLIYTPYNNNITHWMPLPQAPKKGGEE